VNRIEERLRDAFGAAAETVRPESVGVLPGQSRPGRTRRLAPLVAAAAVAIVIIGASVITPLALAGGHRAPAAPSHGSRGKQPVHGLTARPGSGPPRITPNTVGLPASQAQELFAEEGFRSDVTLVRAAGFPSGSVIAQTPVGGTRVASGALVTVIVAAAPGWSPPAAHASPSAATSTAVPDTVGMAVNQAVATLQAAGFQVVVQAQAAASVPAGTVIAQTPAGGAEVAAGAVITVVAAAP
jgi:hypothetical protein